MRRESRIGGLPIGDGRSRTVPPRRTAGRGRKAAAMILERAAKDGANGRQHQTHHEREVRAEDDSGVRDMARSTTWFWRGNRQSVRARRAR